MDTLFWLAVIFLLVFLGRAASDAFADLVTTRRWRRSGSRDPEQLQRVRDTHHALNSPSTRSVESYDHGLDRRRPLDQGDAPLPEDLGGPPRRPAPPIEGL